MKTRGDLKRKGQKHLVKIFKILTWGTLKDELITFIPPVQFGRVLDAKQWLLKVVLIQLKTRGDLKRKGQKHLVKIFVEYTQR